MNFKTTVILFALLLVIGGYLFFTRDTEPAGKRPQEHKLVDIAQASDVSKLVIATADGKQMVFEKGGPRNWKMIQPIAADADAPTLDSLVAEVIALKSNNQIDLKTATRTGLDKPQFAIDLTAGGKTTSVKLGDRLAIGNGVYAQVGGKPDVEVVSADILDRMDKPASAFRKLNLIEVPSTDIKRVAIWRKQDSVNLTKDRGEWEITEPAALHADTAAVTDMLGSLTGLRASSFIEDPVETSDLEKLPPKLIVSFSTHLPATQPTSVPATAPAMISLAFLDYDLTKKNMYVKLSNSPFVALVPASTMDSFQKNASDLRDKKVLDVNSDEVSRFSITVDIAAATQPTSRPAKKETLVIERRKQGPDRTRAPYLPTTGPSTSPLTEPALKFSWPGPKGSPWLFAGGGDADDTEINNFLSALHPLRADKFLDTNPATQPSGTYIVTLHTEAAGGAKVADVEIRFLDRGGDQAFIGQYNGLTFEVSRNTIGRFLEGDFKKKPGGAMPSGMPAGMPGGFPGGFGQ